MKEVFTTARLHFRTGVVSLVLFSAVGAVSVGFFLWGLPEGREAAGIAEACFCGVFYLAWVGISVWVILQYYRASVTVDGDLVHIATVLRKRTINLSSVQKARWRSPRFALKLDLPSDTVVVGFDTFRAADSRRLIRLFHERISPGSQEGWAEVPESYYSDNAAREMEATQTRALHRLWWTIAWISPPLGLVCGLVVHFYAVYLGVPNASSWSGLLLVDWLVYGAIIGAVLALLLRGVEWGTRWLQREEQHSVPQ